MRTRLVRRHHPPSCPISRETQPVAAIYTYQTSRRRTPLAGRLRRGGDRQSALVALRVANGLRASRGMCGFNGNACSVCGGSEALGPTHPLAVKLRAGRRDRSVRPSVAANRRLQPDRRPYRADPAAAIASTYRAVSIRLPHRRAAASAAQSATFFRSPACSASHGAPQSRLRPYIERSPPPTRDGAGGCRSPGNRHARPPGPASSRACERHIVASAAPWLIPGQGRLLLFARAARLRGREPPPPSTNSALVW